MSAGDQLHDAIYYAEQARDELRQTHGAAVTVPLSIAIGILQGARSTADAHDGHPDERPRLVEGVTEAEAKELLEEGSP